MFSAIEKLLDENWYVVSGMTPSCSVTRLLVKLSALTASEKVSCSTPLFTSKEKFSKLGGTSSGMSVVGIMLLTAGDGFARISSIRPSDMFSEIVDNAVWELMVLTSLSGIMKVTTLPVVEDAAILSSCTINSPLDGLTMDIVDVLSVVALGSSSNVIDTRPVFRLTSNEVISGPTVSLMICGCMTYGDGEVVRLRGNPTKSVMGSMLMDTNVFVIEVAMFESVLSVVSWLCWMTSLIVDEPVSTTLVAKNGSRLMEDAPEVAALRTVIKSTIFGAFTASENSSKSAPACRSRTTLISEGGSKSAS